MKLVRFHQHGSPVLGVVKDDGIVPLAALGCDYPTMLALVEAGPVALDQIRGALGAAAPALLLADAKLLAPIEKPGKYLAKIGRAHV